MQKNEELCKSCGYEWRLQTDYFGEQDNEYTCGGDKWCQDFVHSDTVWMLTEIMAPREFASYSCGGSDTYCKEYLHPEAEWFCLGEPTDAAYRCECNVP